MAICCSEKLFGIFDNRFTEANKFPLIVIGTLTTVLTPLLCQNLSSSLKPGSSSKFFFSKIIIKKKFAIFLLNGKMKRQ